MELSKIIIKNYRSIKDATIEFDHNCLILLGKNEAGKSNVLKAVASLFGKYPITNKDKRKKIDNERISDYSVKGIFKLSSKDIAEVIVRFRAKYTNTENIVFSNDGTLTTFIETFFGEFVVSIDIKEGAIQQFSRLKYDKKEFDLTTKLYLIGNSVEINSGSVEFDLKTEIFDIIKTLYSEKLYQCHYWQYADSYLLPSRISISSFINSPPSYKALENIFTLCNRENIGQEFTDAMSQDGDYANLLEQISRTVTTTFGKIWKDFKNTAIQLVPDGSEILIKVVNKAKYSFEDRSDGFKKFISILLMLSTQSRSNKISENDIILIDEPDQSLYPTSARYLRDEILSMSTKSKIIYTTHSSYMIDSNCLGRHIIVEKNDDISILRKEDNNSPFSKDELLRRAIGGSIFECIQPMNLIFEGWLDKELFNKHCEYKNIQEDFNQYGTVYLGGISGVEVLVQLLILANKKFVIIADSDETSKNKKTEFIKNYPEYKDSWVSYADIVNGISTMEDFIESNYIEEKLGINGYNNYEYDSTKTAITNIEKAVGNDKVKKQEIKNQLIATISSKNIKADYDTYIAKLKEKIEILD